MGIESTAALFAAKFGESVALKVRRRLEGEIISQYRKFISGNDSFSAAILV